MLTRLGPALLVFFAATGLGRAQARFRPPAWAYPDEGPEPVEDAATQAQWTSVPGSDVRYRRGQALDHFAPPDWHPETHPRMPGVVAHGRPPAVWACAYCHLPDGSGRPENAPLAGLPEAYILQQAAAFVAGQRHSAQGRDNSPLQHMIAVVDGADAAEEAAAAGYFSGLRLPPKVRVIETARIPAVRAEAFVYARDPAGGTEELGGRLLEVADDIGRHELHDAAVKYTAYVPPGSLARGRALAAAGPGGPRTSCLVCHGPDLRGSPAGPPLAGRYPSYLLRQLLAFRSGARSGPQTLPMQPVVGRLTVGDMVALAAYAASLSP